MLKPLGFVATDYVLGIWSLSPVTRADLGELFAEDMLGDDLEAWMEGFSLLKRTFRNVAVIAGLIERNHPGEKRNIGTAGDLQLRPDLRGAEAHTSQTTFCSAPPAPTPRGALPMCGAWPTC